MNFNKFFGKYFPGIPLITIFKGKIAAIERFYERLYKGLRHWSQLLHKTQPGDFSAVYSQKIRDYFIN
jgi:hypothetical protein